MPRIGRLLVVAEIRTDEGLDPECEWNTDGWPGFLAISGVAGDVLRYLILPPGQTNQRISLQQSPGALLVADGPFDLRLAQSDTKLTSVQWFAVWGDDGTQTSFDGDMYLDNPSTTEERRVQLLGFDAGATAFGGAVLRNVVSVVEDGAGRWVRVNFDNGEYRTLTYTTVDGDVVDTFIEYHADDTVKQAYQVNYDGDGFVTTPHTPL